METTIPSYYTARPSRDLIALAHQAIAKTWWEERLSMYDVYVSQVVLEEASRGDPEMAKLRLNHLASFSVLEATPEIESLASAYLENLFLPTKAIRDAAHLAFACAYELD